MLSTALSFNVINAAETTYSQCVTLISVGNVRHDIAIAGASFRPGQEFNVSNEDEIDAFVKALRDAGVLDVSDIRKMINNLNAEGQEALEESRNFLEDYIRELESRGFSSQANDVRGSLSDVMLGAATVTDVVTRAQIEVSREFLNSRFSDRQDQVNELLQLVESSLNPDSSQTDQDQLGIIQALVPFFITDPQTRELFDNAILERIHQNDQLDNGSETQNAAHAFLDFVARRQGGLRGQRARNPAAVFVEDATDPINLLTLAMVPLMRVNPIFER